MTVTESYNSLRTFLQWKITIEKNRLRPLQEARAAEYRDFYQVRHLNSLDAILKELGEAGYKELTKKINANR